MLSFLRDVAADMCASCTQPVSVFKQTFDMAGQGLSNRSSGLSIGNEAQSPSLGGPGGP